jgi:spermidine/putrescine-binding protein
MNSIGLDDNTIVNNGPENALAHQLANILAVRQNSEFRTNPEAALRSFQAREFLNSNSTFTDFLMGEMDRANNIIGNALAQQDGNPVDLLKQSEFVWIENFELVTMEYPNLEQIELLRDHIPEGATLSPAEQENQ